METKTTPDPQPDLTDPASTSEFKTLHIKKLHPTFGAEVSGIDFSQHPLSDEMIGELKSAAAKYGVLVLRNTGMDDKQHVEFSRRWGDLDDIKPYLTKDRKLRYDYYELFDAGNLDEDGGVLAPDSPRAQYNKGNGLFHVDSSFNPRRASYSLLRACVLPPSSLSLGGTTDFADTRAAFATLPSSLQSRLLTANYIAAHSLHHSRKTAAPSYFSSLDPTAYKMARHALVQRHEPSGRTNLYIAAHAHHIEGLPAHESRELLDTLMRHATREENTFSVEWQNVGDLVIWDNTCVMHRAGKFGGGHVRDMRRTTVHDASSTAWGLNDRGDRKLGFAVDGKPVGGSESVGVQRQTAVV